MFELDYNIFEHQRQGQIFVDTRGENQASDNIEEEDSEFNCLCNIDYDENTYEEIMLAVRDDGELQQEVIDRNFDLKKVWRNATTLRKQMCEMQREQLLNRVVKGMSLKQAMIDRDSLDGGFSIGAFLFDGSNNDIRRDDAKRKRLFAQLSWSHLFEGEVLKITESAEFVHVWKEINENDMDEAIYLPRPRDVARIERQMHIIKSIVSTFAAIRMMRDNISAQAARDIVMRCKGINARVFFG